MRRRNFLACLVVAVVLLLGAAVTEQARAAGYWNMPGTHAQRSGHGFGGGYHASLILGPVRHDGWGLGGPVRLPYAPSPYYGCESCGDCGRMLEAPSSLEGVVPTTAPAPAVAPTLAPVPAVAALLEKPYAEPAPVAPSDSASAAPTPFVESANDAVATRARQLFGAPVQP